MNDLDIAIAFAFRSLLNRSGKSQKDFASGIDLTSSAISKVLNFKQKLTFAQAHLFCLKFGIDISEMSKLVVKVSQDKNLLESIRQTQANKKQANISMKDLLGKV